MKKNDNIIVPNISEKLKAFRQLELEGIDGDLLVAAAEAKMGYVGERLQRLQMRRDLQRILKIIKRKSGTAK